MTPRFDLSWLGRNGDVLLAQFREHVELTALAVLIGLLVALPLALAAHRAPVLRTPLLAAAGALYTVPSLALFVLLVAVTGLTRTTALTGLVLYSLLILLRNVLVGLDGVPADVREAAVGMGHTPRQLLWRVELPLALPVVVAGVRLATVSTIGLVTITALIGQGGLGRLFLLGFQRRNGVALLAGFVLSVVLAVAADLALIRVERRLTPWGRRQAGAETVRPADAVPGAV